MLIFDWIFSCLTDPVLRGPLYTCIFMGACGGIIGVWLLFQKQSLIGEVLSHSTFPGMILGAIIWTYLSSSCLNTLPYINNEFIWLLLGGFISSYIGLIILQYFVKKKLAYEDSALSFVLSSTFGIGLLFISVVQKEYPSLWRKLMNFLMGQAATISNQYILVAFFFFIFICASVLIWKRSFLSYLFDSQFTSLHRLMPKWIETATLVAIIITAMLGIRIMGVVLMSAILTFPAVIARLLSDKAYYVTILAAVIGAFSSGLGVIASHSIASSCYIQDEAGRSLWLPTGPIIVLIMSLFFITALLFSPRHGWMIKAIRRYLFHFRCNRENILKFLWKECSKDNTDFVLWNTLTSYSPFSIESLKGKIFLILLETTGYIKKEDKGVKVTAKGLIAGRQLVRLHRLWELYLVEYCGMGKDAVHPSAEEMEHILTPEMEKELCMILNDPDVDPHKQPIPTQSEYMLLLSRCCTAEKEVSYEQNKKSHESRGRS